MDSIKRLIIGNNFMEKLIFNVNVANTYLHGQNEKYNVYQVMYLIDQNT
jgi:hypothetical protein